MAHTATTGTWYMIKQLLLVSLAAICFAAFMILWLLKPDAKELEKKVVEVEQEVVRSVQMETIANSENIGAFIKEVPEMNLTQRVVVSGEHDPEFRGNRFVSSNKAKYTIQVMDVSDEKVVLSYLSKRPDRSKFNYLRTQDGKNPERYVVIYGVHKDQQTATEEMAKMNFGLPASVSPSVKKIGDYEKFVNDLGSEEKGVSTGLRNVVLARVSQPRVAPANTGANQLPIPPAPPKNSNTVSTRSLVTTGPLPYNPPAPKPAQQQPVPRKSYDISPKSDDTPRNEQRPQRPSTSSNQTTQRPPAPRDDSNNKATNTAKPVEQPRSTNNPTPRQQTNNNATPAPAQQELTPPPRRSTEQVVDPF